MLLLSLISSALGAFLSTNDFTTTALPTTDDANSTDLNTVPENTTEIFRTENSTIDNNFLGMLDFQLDK
jgi:hypothetical protein